MSVKPVTFKSRFAKSPAPAATLPFLQTSGTTTYWGLKATFCKVFGIELQHAETEADDNVSEIDGDDWEESRAEQVFGGCFVNAPAPGYARDFVSFMEVGYGAAIVQSAVKRWDAECEEQAAIMSCSAAGGTIALALLGRAKLPGVAPADSKIDGASETKQGLEAEEEVAADTSVPPQTQNGAEAHTNAGPSTSTDAAEMLAHQEKPSPEPKQTQRLALNEDGVYFGRKDVEDAVDLLPVLHLEHIAITTNAMGDGKYAIFIIAQLTALPGADGSTANGNASPAASMKINYVAGMRALQERAITAIRTVGGSVRGLKSEFEQVRGMLGLLTDDDDDSELEPSEDEEDEDEAATKSVVGVEKHSEPKAALHPQKRKRNHTTTDGDEGSLAHGDNNHMRPKKKIRSGKHLPTPPATSSPEKLPATGQQPKAKRKREAIAIDDDEEDESTQAAERTRLLLPNPDVTTNEAPKPQPKPKRKYTRKNVTAPQTVNESYGKGASSTASLAKTTTTKKRKAGADDDDDGHGGKLDAGTQAALGTSRKTAKKRKTKIDISEPVVVPDDSDDEFDIQDARSSAKSGAKATGAAATVGKKVPRPSGEMGRESTGGKKAPTSTSVKGKMRQGGKAPPRAE